MTATRAELPAHQTSRIAGWLLLAERGWHLFPVRAGDKRPAIREWPHRATTDLNRLIRYFTEHPASNAGIACGPSGLYVIDADVPKPGAGGLPGGGIAVLSELAATHGGLPATWTVATPSGGRHHYFRRPAGAALGNTARTLGSLLDTRGAGGYVLAPGCWLAPTRAHLSRPGHLGGWYELLDDTDPAELPTWIHRALTERRATAASAAPERPRSAGAWPSRYVDHIVGEELRRVHSAGPGQHNSAVFTAARALGQLAAGGALDHHQAEQLLTRAAARIAGGPCDCTPRALAASIRSGLTYGARRPRRLPQLEDTHRRYSA